MAVAASMLRDVPCWEIPPERVLPAAVAKSVQVPGSVSVSVLAEVYPPREQMIGSPGRHWCTTVDAADLFRLLFRPSPVHVSIRMQQTALPMHGKLGTTSARTSAKDGMPHRRTEATSRSSAGLTTQYLGTYCLTHIGGFSWLPLRDGPLD
ncbi:uncharacterized protein LY79DRAFT_577895 [Colletotrichum navitas]|uniref:Uncharacterized protein n=1 Tax=Colletotrichum navitas TaxID=681940 RepID=A0AAD8Q595_9PEZI|nr:uncharacterized protein LY79DRAFT_577895 [Colletotrichum navitas]KAK1595513.1 hypothetical protein LY79DRAFT_577895 [Colletotrichum navitas]